MFKLISTILLSIFTYSTWFASSLETVEVISTMERLKFFLVLVPAAIWDSINPCAFAVMFILLSSILKEQKSRKKVIFAWLMFVLSVFISYVAMGLGLYKALATTNNTFYLKLFVWIIWILVWLANLKDYFWYWKWFKMEVPDSWRPKMWKILKKVVSPTWAFIVWFLISLFLLPCTSGPYITILWYLASESSSINLWGYIYIIIYNIIFVLPMIAIAFIVAFGYKNIWELKEYKEMNVEKLHLITWVIMLLLWIYILFDLFYV